jgi:hypothetical protein
VQLQLDDLCLCGDYCFCSTIYLFLCEVGCFCFQAVEQAVQPLPGLWLLGCTQLTLVSLVGCMPVSHTNMSRMPTPSHQKLTCGAQHQTTLQVLRQCYKFLELQEL